MSKFITYKELEKIVQESNIGVRVKVQSNPFGQGGEIELTFIIDEDGQFSASCCGQYYINDIRYTLGSWEDDYDGTFELVEPAHVKPEVLPVGTYVKILQNIKDCGDYNEWTDFRKNYIGRKFIICKVNDNCFGVYYSIAEISDNICNYEGIVFPHYAVQKCNSLKPETVEANGKIVLKSEYDLAIAGLEEIKK